MKIELKDIPFDIRIEVTHYIPERHSMRYEEPDDPMELEYEIFLVGKSEIEIDVSKLRTGDREAIEEMILKEIEENGDRI